MSEILPPFEPLHASEPPSRADVLECAAQFDKEMNHFTDRVLKELDYTAHESYWLDNLLNTHREIAEMAFRAIDRE